MFEVMKRSRSALVIGALLILLLVVFGKGPSCHQSDPEYKGKPLSRWLPYFEEEYATFGATTNFDTAILRVGSNAVPLLVRMLRENHPVKDEFLAVLAKQKALKITHVRTHLRNHLAARGFEVLGAAANDAVPSLIETLDKDIAPSSRAATAAALGNIGPAAEQAIPSLLRVLAGKSSYEKSWACYALVKIHSNPGQIVPALMRSALDSDVNVRLAATAALGQLGPDAKSAVPVLVETLRDPDTAVSYAASKALLRVDFATAQSIGLSTNARSR